MKKFLFILALALPVAVPLSLTSCASLGTEKSRQNEVITLKIAGASAKTTIDAAAAALARGQINVAQFQQIGTFYDMRWQPAYQIAVNAAHSDLSTFASPDLMALFGQLAALASTYIPVAK